MNQKVSEFLGCYKKFVGKVLLRIPNLSDIVMKSPIKMGIGARKVYDYWYVEIYGNFDEETISIVNYIAYCLGRIGRIYTSRNRISVLDKSRKFAVRIASFICYVLDILKKPYFLSSSKSSLKTS